MLRRWALGTGHPVIIPHYVPSFPVTKVSHSVLLQPPQSRSAWLSPSSTSSRLLHPTTEETSGCVWAQHGVWEWDEKRGEIGEGVVLKMDYFRYFPDDVVIEGCAESEGGKDGKRGKRKQGEEVDWYRCVLSPFFATFSNADSPWLCRDFYFPFCRLFAQRISEFGAGGSKPEIAKGWWNLVEPIPNEVRSPLSLSPFAPMLTSFPSLAVRTRHRPGSASTELRLLPSLVRFASAVREEAGVDECECAGSLEGASLSPFPWF